MNTTIQHLWLFILVLLLANVSVCAQESRLLAPIPPDAISYDDPKTAALSTIPERGFSVSFHTPLSVNDAAEFYRQQIGALNPLESGKNYQATLLEINIKQLGVLKVYDIPREPGIKVQGIQMMTSARCLTDIFEPFRRMHRELDQYSREDFDKLCQRYGYLEHAFFGFSDETIFGEPLSNKEVLRRKYTRELDKKAGEEMTMEELASEAQRLMQQGRMEEATALLERLAVMQQQAMTENMQGIQTGQQAPVEDHWDQWLDFLRQLEELVYPTIVHIDYHPDHWPDDEWLRESVDW